MASFNLISFNTGGLRDKLKIHSLLNLTSWDILCLQETKWDRKWVEYCQSATRDHLCVSLGTALS